MICKFAIYFRFAPIMAIWLFINMQRELAKSDGLPSMPLPIHSLFPAKVKLYYIIPTAVSLVIFVKKNYFLLIKYSSFLDSPYVVILSKSGPSLHFSPSPTQWSQFDQEGSIFNRTTSSRPSGEIEVGMRNVIWDKI